MCDRPRRLPGGLVRRPRCEATRRRTRAGPSSGGLGPLAGLRRVRLGRGGRQRRECARAPRAGLRGRGPGPLLPQGPVVICSVRPYRADDAQALYEAARESIPDVFPWLAWCHPDYSMAEAVDWTRSKASAGSAAELVFAVVGPNDELLGGCGVNQVNRIHRFANLGYWVRSSA